MTKPPETVVLKCPKCGHFLGELGNFLRIRCCGYEIVIVSLREDALTTSRRASTVPASTT